VAVVPDKAPADRAVVVLVLDTPTPAGVERLPGYNNVVVVILVVFSVDDAAAGCLQADEMAVRVHDHPRYELPRVAATPQRLCNSGDSQYRANCTAGPLGVRQDPKPPRELRRGTVYAQRPARCKRDFRRGLCACATQALWLPAFAADVVLTGGWLAVVPALNVQMRPQPKRPQQRHAISCILP
jgi:hypothetical protein